MPSNDSKESADAPVTDQAPSLFESEIARQPENLPGQLPPQPSLQSKARDKKQTASPTRPGSKIKKVDIRGLERLLRWSLELNIRQTTKLQTALELIDSLKKS